MIYKYCVKRIIDITISLIALLILSPILLLITITLLIATESDPFFIQLRPGLNGKIFKIIKFKTMNDYRDSSGNLLSDDQRLTTIGKFVRKTSLDEFPQLINVLMGDMSLIGPRPLLVQYLPLYSILQARRHEIRPGITGWAQVNGRNTISWSKKFEFDIWYVDHLSFWLDLKIIFLSIKKVVIREGISSATSATMEAFNGNN
jgi:lipopolysaccharide/colanic/teichoic acid biosynthesis glycosyltransferase